LCRLIRDESSPMSRTQATDNVIGLRSAAMHLQCEVKTSLLHIAIEIIQQGRTHALLWKSRVPGKIDELIDIMFETLHTCPHCGQTNHGYSCKRRCMPQRSQRRHHA